MQLVDASGDRLPIEPWGCITLGGSWKNYYYSAWAIDQASKTQPSQEELDKMICDKNITGEDAFGDDRCIAEWYPVDLPAGFLPVQYNAGCALFDVPFDFL
jgi:hypothetical protein